MSKSRTTTKGRTTSSPRVGKGALHSRRLPEKRPPTHPGEMLLEELLKPMGISQRLLAERMEVSSSRVAEVVRKRRGVTPKIALRLARVVGMPADFWLGLQQNWDLWQAMHRD
ncbi:MAG: HigA family addiction module antidote protein [Armatimonadetes bacterium]|nr:HigA family addiction module antidote protein [Armatimonadota bacterium]PIU64545.1 MAG: addiction module antidote protein, HigA family [Armatimonadetes bacterium CG07_land_8_20_14_0_80_59_28]PIY46210.1 MAG: addiction module antidote protein, HigA family [Armatimonadetes bacterium CG_4_10_14_3_um_filter_59_10]PJB68914.1 MAG: addiction module antidote protein, HigA family [Armatimonadetes bacterium CG_4_9_14_3_um_filter_58_7]